jgi:hypothetical protein
MLNTQLSDAFANACANAGLALANGGYLKFYTGPQPANGNTAITTQTLLASLPLSATAFGNAVGGLATSNALTPATIAATGTPVWARVFKSDGVTQLFDLSVGVSQAITAVTNADPAVMTSAGHGLTDGQFVGISGFTGAWAAANGKWQVDVTSASQFSIPINASGFGAISGSPIISFDINVTSSAWQVNATASQTSFTFAILEAGQ